MSILTVIISPIRSEEVLLFLVLLIHINTPKQDGNNTYMNNIYIYIYIYIYMCVCVCVCVCVCRGICVCT